MDHPIDWNWAEELAEGEAAGAQAMLAEAELDDEPSFLDKLRAALIDTKGLDSIPEPEPLIQDVLYRNSTAWLIGVPGHGKSFVAIDMAGCVGTGEHWQLYPTVPGKVLYLIAEGATGIKQRVRAWEECFGHPMDNVVFLPVAVQSANDSEWSALVALVEEMKPALIVIDTQARVTVGCEENSARDMGIFVHKVEKLRIVSSACVLVVHHQGRGGGDHMRGSSAMDGAATTVIKVSKEDDSVEVECTKQKDAAPFDPLRLRMVPTGESVVLAPADGQRPVSAINQPGVRKMLADWWAMHETEWLSMTKLVDSGAAQKTTFYRYRIPLERAGLIEKKGENSATRYRLPREVEL